MFTTVRLVLDWLVGGLMTAGGIGIISMRWQVALLALPAFAIEAVRSRREED